MLWPSSPKYREKKNLRFSNSHISTPTPWTPHQKRVVAPSHPWSSERLNWWKVSKTKIVTRDKMTSMIMLDSRQTNRFPSIRLKEWAAPGHLIEDYPDPQVEDNLHLGDQSHLSLAASALETSQQERRLTQVGLSWRVEHPNASNKVHRRQSLSSVPNIRNKIWWPHPHSIQHSKLSKITTISTHSNSSNSLTHSPWILHSQWEETFQISKIKITKLRIIHQLKSRKDKFAKNFFHHWKNF